jgi:hypothetical protein
MNFTPEEKLHRKGKCQACIGSNKPVSMEINPNPKYFARQLSHKTLSKIRWGKDRDVKLK